jgi:hypothetical protein
MEGVVLFPYHAALLTKATRGGLINYRMPMEERDLRRGILGRRIKGR